ncbi:EAL domain-containing protein [Neptuniibacter sp. QD48_11]|uniref:bifunctional diguanylate cyclase/phosphodiesterase n=1 Tax=Neptuniibacter sp. QD48_11 TaxID=3398211 RepID=UPI0039F4CE09
MLFIRNNIWLAFYVFLLAGFAAFIFILTKTHESIREDVRLEQENLTRITSNSVEATLRQYETLLDILGQELLHEDKYLDREKTIQEIDKLYIASHTTHNFFQIDLDGNIVVTNSLSQDKRESSLNLLKNPKAKESFNLTLDSNAAVIGRTYFSYWENALIIPIRKTIRDANGKPLFIVSLTINIEKGLPFFSNTNEHSADYSVFIYRDRDRYFQVAPKRLINNPAVYEHQFSEGKVQESIDYVEKTYNISFETIKEKQIVTTHVTGKFNDDSQSMMSNFYIKEFQLWVGVERDTQVIRQKFFQAATNLSLVFFFAYAVIYWLFRVISNNEKKKEELLTYRATHDFLTNLPNRYFLDNYFSKLEEQNSYHLLFVDMDNFKSANDNFGHDYGDQVLIEITRRLKLNTQDRECLVARYSGDEFVVVAFNLSSFEAERLAEDILEEISKPYLMSGNRLILSASIGISHCPTDASSFEEVKRLSDFALYEAKHNKNCYTVFHEELKKRYLDDLSLETKLRDAIKNEEIYVVFQPQVSSEGLLSGLESLVRWHSKEFGPIPPNRFIPIAENSGLMPELGRYIIRKSLDEAGKLTSSDCSISINVSIKQFFSDGFFEYFSEQADQSQINKSRLKIEITESLFIQDLDYVLGMINQFKAEGISVSLDDFGTGYSSLSLLKNLPIDELKIDKSFVDDIVEDQDARLLLQGIIDIAHKMGITIVAEGVETLEQKQILDDLGCEVFQGYYFYKPMPMKEAAEEFN